MIIIGITGTAGSGKGTVVDYLVSRYGFKHFSARAFLSEEVVHRGLPPTRDNMRMVANDLRATYSPSYVAEQLYVRAQEHGGNAVLESLRTVGEVEALRAKPGTFVLLSVDADPKSRYERIVKRKSSTDHVSYEKFLDDESRELDDPDPAGMKVAKCMQMADYKIMNDAGVPELKLAVDKIVQPLLPPATETIKWN